MKWLLSTRRCASTIGGSLDYLKAIAIVFAFASTPEAFAQVCCPSGCVQDGNNCVTTGPSPRSCPRAACPPGTSGGQPSGTSGQGTAQDTVHPPGGGQCMQMQLTQAQINAATNKCMKALTSNAELLGCLFENAANKVADAQAGMTCPRRQAALANQCRSRCQKYATSISTLWCSNDDYYDSKWKDAFGDIGGQTVGSASVAACGPPLPSKTQRLLRTPPH